MSTTKKDFMNGCFSPDWIEFSSEEAREQQVIREERLETKRRKDLKILLQELEEIRQNIERVAEKQHRLANLMGFYNGEFAQ